MIDLMITDLANIRHAELLQRAEEHRKHQFATNRTRKSVRTWRIDLGKLHINVWFGSGSKPVAQV